MPLIPSGFKVPFQQRISQSKAAKSAVLQSLGMQSLKHRVQAQYQAQGGKNSAMIATYPNGSQNMLNPYCQGTTSSSTTTTNSFYVSNLTSQTVTITNGTNSASNPIVTVGAGGGGGLRNPLSYYLSPDIDNQDSYVYKGGRDIKIDGDAKKIYLPDGTYIDLKADGSYEIIDKDAKVTYRASKIREFNAYLNASDKLEEFIRYCGKEGIKKGEMLQLPLQLFVAWLIIESAKADNENPPDDVKLLPDLRAIKTPKCLCCGRFISHHYAANQIRFCSPICFDRQLLRIGPRLTIPSLITHKAA